MSFNHLSQFQSPEAIRPSAETLCGITWPGMQTDRPFRVLSAFPATHAHRRQRTSLVRIQGTNDLRLFQPRSRHVGRHHQFYQGAVSRHSQLRDSVRRETVIRASALTSILSVLPPPGGPANNSVVPLSLQGTTLNPPATVPVKQRRQFSCGSSAYTTWYSTASAQDLASPPQQVVPAVGELYIHHNRLEDKHQIWLYGLDSVWKCVTGVEKVYHPTIDDRVLSVRANGTPNWITAASYTTIRGRRCKKTQAE